MPRHIVYVSGTRADFGLMRSTLQQIDGDARTRLSVIATGMHLDPRHGNTMVEIEAAGLSIAALIALPEEAPSGAAMARGIGTMIGGMTDALETLAPDMVLLLGDRGEMLAGAIVASHLLIPTAHIAGGERSGTIDEPVRHAISKLATYHFVTTAESRDRLARMGEREDHIFVTGAPSLDDILSQPLPVRAEVVTRLGLPEGAEYLLTIFHPVLDTAAAAGEAMRTVIAALREIGMPVVVLMPNSDAGSDAVRAAIEEAAGEDWLFPKVHLARDLYIPALAHAAALVGNSSSGIVEAASFGTPVVNIGDRQSHRERNANVMDVTMDHAAIVAAVRNAIDHPRPAPTNIFGDGKSGARIADLVATLPIEGRQLVKLNSY